MKKLELEVENNTMTNGKALVSLPNNLNGLAKVKGNTLIDVEQGVVVRDQDSSIEVLLLEYLKEDIPQEKVKEVVSAIKSLREKNLDTVSETLFSAKLNQYLKVGTTIIGLANVILGIPGLGS
ncbi:MULTISPECIES: hypothetical protein [Acinetobacter]|jgi:hypothetical protein|uniref:Uncharacterized protein n=1 Tax=Acinetobacter rongchengensis TaxID=2419601 RepID=A0A3A8ENN2_9GAMM|nr:hypothetical protein [Acinetobacter rongchengensis]RKG31574.1 hypothetical protein D7V20_18595 [Acinetobacter rongchengensis]